MSQKKGKKLTWLKEHQFTSEKQPSPDVKRAGHKRKKDLKELNHALIKDVKAKEINELAKKLGIDIPPEDLYLDVVMTMKQVEKAMNGDTKAYLAVMDRMLGKPVQQTVNTHEFDVSNRKGLGWDQEE